MPNKKESTSAEDQERIRALTRQNMELEGRVQELSARISEKSRDVEALSSQIIEIKSSTAWKIVQLLWKIRSKAFPRGGRIEKPGGRIHGFIEPPSTAGSAFLQEDPKRKPVASIVIAVFNGLAHTQECLESLEAANTSVPFEVIVVNNGSTDDTKPWFESYSQNRPNMRMISFEANLGFGAGINVGIRKSVGEYTVILNNDTVVTPKWLDNMLSVFKQDKTIGIVSPVTNYTAPSLQLDAKAKNLHLQDAREYADSIQGRPGFLYEPSRLTFFCAMLSRELIDKIGLLDERYGLGNFEDYDYCFRARMAGYRLAIASNSFVYHHGSVTFRVNQINYAEQMEKNQIKYFSRVDELASTTLRSGAGSEKSKAIETSVIVYTRNRPFTFQRAMTSLANQTYQDFEVVIVNDSRQDLSHIIDIYRKYLNITHICDAVEQRRSRALNSALKKTSGKWVGYLDDSDFLYPWHLECLTNGLRENPDYKFAYSNYNRALMRSEIESIPLKIEAAAAWEFDRDDLLVSNRIPMHCWLHEKDCIAQAGYFDETIDLLEDYELLLRCSKNQDFLHINRVTGENRMYLSEKYSIADVQKVIDSLRTIHPRHPVTNHALEEKRQIMVRGMENRVKEIEKIHPNAKDEAEAQEEIMTLIRRSQGGW